MMIRIITFGLLVVLLLDSCKPEIFSPAEEKPVDLTTIIAKGQFIVPIEFGANSSLEIHSGFSQEEVRIIQKTPEMTTGSFEIELIENSLQLIILADDEVPIAYALVEPQNTEEYLMIDSESTALSLLLLHPMLFESYDVISFLDLINHIKSKQLFLDLVQETKEKMVLKDIDAIASGETYQTLLFDLVNEAYGDIIQDENGLLFQKISNKGPTFIVTNSRKRWVSIYAQSKNTNELEFNDRYLKNSTKGDNILLENYLLEAPPFKIGIDLFSGFQFEVNTLFDEKDSPRLKVDASEGDSKYKVLCYGVGVVQDVDDFTEEDLNKMIAPIVYSAFFEFTIPTIEVIFGLGKDRNGKFKGLRGELRGRPRNDKLAKLINELRKDFLTESVKQQLLNTVRNGQELDMFKIIASTVSGFLTDSDNFRLIKNMLREIYLDKEALFFAKEILPSFNLYNRINSGIQAGNAYLTMFITDAITEFNFDGNVTNEGIFSIYPISLDEFGAVSSLAVSPDGSEIWATDGFDFYKYNASIDNFEKILFWDEVYLANGGGGGGLSNIAGVFSIDINPLTNDLFILVAAGGPVLGPITGNKSIIYKYSNEEFEIVLEAENIRQGIYSIGFDPFGNLWFEVSSDSEHNFGTNGINRLNQNGSVEVFNQFFIDDEFGQLEVNVRLNGGSNENDNPDILFSNEGRPILISGDNIYELMLDGTLNTLFLNSSSIDYGLEYVYESLSNDLFLSIDGGLGQYLNNNDTIVYYDSFKGYEPDFINTINHFYEDGFGRIWFSFNQSENAVFLIYNSTIEIFTPSSSNLPGDHDDYFGNWINEIDGAANGDAWLVYGNRYILKSNL